MATGKEEGTNTWSGEHTPADEGGLGRTIPKEQEGRLEKDAQAKEKDVDGSKRKRQRAKSLKGKSTKEERGHFQQSLHSHIFSIPRTGRDARPEDVPSNFT